MKQIALSLLVITASGAYVWEQSGREARIDFTAVPPADAGPAIDLGPRVINSPLSAPSRPVLVEVRTDSVRTAAIPAGRMKEPATGQTRPSALVAAASPQAVARASNDIAVSRDVAIAPAPLQIEPAAPVSTVSVPIPRPRPAYQPAAAPVTKVAMKVAGGGSYNDGLYVGPAADAYYGIIQIEAIVEGGRLAGIKVLQYPSDRRTSVRINRQALPMLRDEAVTAQSAAVDIISGATLTSRAFIRSLDGALRQAAV